MFLGAHIRVLDRMRIKLPASFLEEIGKSSIILTRWATERCLSLLLPPEWKKIVQRLQSISTTNINIKSFMRWFFSSTSEEEPDNKGRIYIPGYSQEYANLKRDVLVLGLVNRIELWNPSDFNKLEVGKMKEIFLPNELVEIYQDKASQLMSHVRLSYKQSIGSYRSHTDKGVRHLFLCYSSNDKKFVRRLARDLVREGITVWLDEWEMLPGDSLYKKIQEGIQQASWFGVVLSPSSIDSQWCKRELHNALEEEFRRNHVFVIPILYRTCEIPGFLKEKVYVDLRKGNYKKEFAYLLRRFDI